MSGVADVELLAAGVEAFQSPQDIFSWLLVAWNGLDWMVVETKFGMQMMHVTT